MGREAHCACTLGAHTEAVKALLESDAVIVRGATLKRRFARPSLSALAVSAGALQFRCGADVVSLALGADEAARWLHKLQAPPPTLAAKLGISAERPAAVQGPTDDAELAQALQGATTDVMQQASVLLAVVATEAQLEQALAVHAGMPCPGLWVVHGKGRVAFGDTAVRTLMRARGYTDHKSCAVSGTLTATRYHRGG
jgi:hypothetical protein